MASIQLVNVPDDILTSHSRLYQQELDEEAKELVTLLSKQIRKERTAMAMINTVLTMDAMPEQFFNILRQNWCTWHGRAQTLSTNPLCQMEEYRSGGFEADGFVSLPDNKLLCTGCGGIALDLPKWGTLTLIHAMLNPTCKAFLGDREFDEKCVGKLLPYPPRLDEQLVKDKVQQLLDSDFILHNKEFKDEKESFKSFEDVYIPDGMPSPKKRAQAGWYAIETLRETISKCFCCGGEIRYWRETDCPWMEHLCIYPSCPFLHAVLDEEDIRAILAGQTERINREALWPLMVYDYFQKRVFPAIYVNYERIKWNAASTSTQLEHDHWKETLLINWILNQRLTPYVSSEEADEPITKRKRQVDTWGSLMTKYQANARMVDLNVQV